MPTTKKLRTFNAPLLTAMLSVFGHLAVAQDLPNAPTLSPEDKPAILFAVEDHTGEKDESGKPAQSVLDPIAFVVEGQFRGCSTPASTAMEVDPGEDLALKYLRKAYAKGARIPVWFRGHPWGEAEAFEPCLNDLTSGDSPVDWGGCFQLHPNTGQQRLPTHAPEMRRNVAIAFTGVVPAQSHEAIRSKATGMERSIFMAAAASVYAEHKIHVASNSIHVGTIWKTQLQKGRTALIGSTVYQFPLKDKKKVWNSDRVFLVLEETGGTYAPVLADFNVANFYLEDDRSMPKIGEVLDEENSHNEQRFVDNFPIFAGEPDVIVTEHLYYEDWAYSIYRRTGTKYKLVYTGCGGGD